MQRRAAAIYVAFFLIVGAASYTLVATASEPAIQFEDPEYRLSSGEQFTVGGETYTVGSIDATMEGGDHGSAASLVRSGQVQWLNDSAQYTRTWENNSTVTFQGQEWRALVRATPNATDENTTEVVLREEINETAILQDDPRADDEIVEHEGGRYVAIRENNTTRLIPVEEYFPVPGTQTLSEGDEVEYLGNQSTISVAPVGVTLTWEGERNETIDLADRSNVTVGGEQYLAYFPDNDTVVLTQQYSAYQQELNEQQAFIDHKNGLWGITIVSLLTVVLLTAMAYLPSRY